jgi:VWFA-related protein
MRHRLFSQIIASSIALSMTGGGGALAQSQTDSQSTPTFGIGTSSVLLDVVVRDKHGNLVRDLTAADFDVFEDGVKQSVDSFRIISKEGEPAAASNAAGPAKGAAEAPAASAQPSPATAAAAPAASASVIAFVFDRMSVNARDMAHKAALTYASKGHVEGDVAGVFSIDIALHTIQPFTTDINLIRAAFDRALQQGNTSFANSGDRSDTRDTVDSLTQAQDFIANTSGQGADPNAIGAASSQATFDQMQVSMSRTFESLELDAQGFSTTNALHAVVNGLKRIPGRKTLIFFSEGLVIPPNVQAQFQAVIASANRANVSVYAMDAGGLRVNSQTDETKKELNQAVSRRMSQYGNPAAAAADGDLLRVMERNETLLSLNPSAGLGQLATGTGGFLIENTNDASGAFRRVAEDMRFYYLLSYAPTNDSFDGSFRSISVKLHRPGMEVQARKGYFAVKPSETATPLMTYEAPAVVQLDRQPRPDAFPLGVAAMSFPEPKRPGLVPVVVEVPGDAIAYAPGKDKAKMQDYSADFSVVVRIKNAQQQEVDRMSQHYLLNASAANLEAAKKGNVLFYREASLHPGSYTVEAVGYDAVAKKASVRTASLEVREVAENRPRLSSVMLVKRADKLAANDQKNVNPLYFGDTVLYPSMGEPFHKATAPALGFFFTVYGSADATRKASIEVRKGDQTVGAATTELEAPDATGRIQHAGALPLQSFSAGTYTLKVTIADSHGSDSRVVPFTVVD